MYLELQILHVFCLSILKIEADEASSNTLPVMYALMLTNGLNNDLKAHRRLGIVDIISERECQWFESAEITEVRLC